MSSTTALSKTNKSVDENDAPEHGSAHLSGGAVGSDDAPEHGSAHLSGGAVGSDDAPEHGSAHSSGGAVGSDDAPEHGSAHLSGGAVGSDDAPEHGADHLGGGADRDDDDAPEHGADHLGGGADRDDDDAPEHGADHLGGGAPGNNDLSGHGSVEGDAPLDPHTPSSVEGVQYERQGLEERTVVEHEEVNSPNSLDFLDFTPPSQRGTRGGSPRAETTAEKALYAAAESPRMTLSVRKLERSLSSHKASPQREASSAEPEKVVVCSAEGTKSSSGTNKPPELGLLQDWLAGQHRADQPPTEPDMGLGGFDALSSGLGESPSSSHKKEQLQQWLSSTTPVTQAPATSVPICEAQVTPKKPLRAKRTPTNALKWLTSPPAANSPRYVPSWTPSPPKDVRIKANRIPTPPPSGSEETSASEITHSFSESGERSSYSSNSDPTQGPWPKVAGRRIIESTSDETSGYYASLSPTQTSEVAFPVTHGEDQRQEGETFLHGLGGLADDQPAFQVSDGPIAEGSGVFLGPTSLERNDGLPSASPSMSRKRKDSPTSSQASPVSSKKRVVDKETTSKKRSRLVEQASTSPPSQRPMLTAPTTPVAGPSVQMEEATTPQRYSLRNTLARQKHAESERRRTEIAKERATPKLRRRATKVVVSTATKQPDVEESADVVMDDESVSSRRLTSGSKSPKSKTSSSSSSQSQTKKSGGISKPRLSGRY